MPDTQELKPLADEWNICCFVTGKTTGNNSDLKSISFYVESSELGEELAQLFNGGAHLDNRSSEPNEIKIRIAALPEHRRALSALRNFWADNNFVFTPEIIAKARGMTISPGNT